MQQQHINRTLLCLALLVACLIGSAGGSGAQQTTRQESLPSVPGDILVQIEEVSPAPAVPGAMALRVRDDIFNRLRDHYDLSDKAQPQRPRSATSAWRLFHTDRDVKQLCAELRTDPAVAAVQPNYRYRICRTPNDPDFPDQYAHTLIHMEEAWDISTGSRDIVVAVLDTGIDVNHPDLRDNIWINPGEIPNNDIDDDNNGYIDDVHGWNFESDSNEVNPTVDAGASSDSVITHGTMVAGVIAATGDNDIGVTGVNWAGSVMALRLSLEITSVEVAAGLDYAAANGADVLNMSFAADEFGPEGDPIVREAIDRAYAAGVLLIASAGNDDTGRPNYPAAYYNVMAVSSTDGEDMKTGHSSFGPWVDIAAPGTDIVTTTFDESYVATAGTSFSSPYIGAVAALVMAANPELTAVEVRAILENTTDDVYYGEVDPGPAYIGTGRTNAFTALQAADIDLPLGEIAEPRPRQTYPADQHDVTVRMLVHGDTYALSYRGSGETSWLELPGDTGPADAADLVEQNLPNPGVGVYELRLQVTTGDTTHTDIKVFGIETASSQDHWPRPEKAVFPPDQVYLGSPLCLDITGDGQLEIIQSGVDIETYDGLINVWTADGNDLDGWPLNTGFFFASALASGDIDGDGDFELIATDEYGEVMGWHIEDRTALDGDWPLVPGSWYSYIYAPPVLADLDGDGDSEIIVALDYESGSSDGLHAIQHDGTFLWQRRYTSDGPMSVADMDGDGSVEIALSGYGPGISNLYTYLLNDRGQLIKKWKGGSSMGTVIADMDLDGEYELLFCTEDGVQAVHRDGAVLWKTPIYGPFSEYGSMSVGDLDQDGRREFFVNAYVEADGYTFALLYAFDADGEPLPDYPKSLMGVPDFCTPLIADIDGDGQKEVLAGAAGAPLMAWEADGSSTPGFPLLNVVPQYDGPVVADIDRDGDAEILVNLDDYRFNIIDMPGAFSPHPLDWARPRHDPQNSGWLEAGPVLDLMVIPGEVQPGEKVTIPLTVTGSTAGAPRFVVSNLPPGGHYDPETTSVIWKPTVDQVFQSYHLSFLVTNGIHQDRQSATIAVVPDAIYAADMNTDPGWQLDPGWTWGQPTGQGSWNGDPNGAYTGTHVIGYVLDGDYANHLAEPRYATLGPIDGSGYGDIHLSFWRWLGLESPYDGAAIQASSDGTTWQDLWTHGNSHIADTAWQFVELSVPAALGDNRSTLFFRWGLGPTDDTVTYPGWNIDDVQVTGTELE
jgi:subtilisin family serine protease